VVVVEAAAEAAAAVADRAGHVETVAVAAADRAGHAETVAAAAETASLAVVAAAASVAAAVAAAAVAAALAMTNVLILHMPVTNDTAYCRGANSQVISGNSYIISSTQLL
jgi:hypothetical protein